MNALRVALFTGAFLSLCLVGCATMDDGCGTVENSLSVRATCVDRSSSGKTIRSFSSCLYTLLCRCVQNCAGPDHARCGKSGYLKGNICERHIHGVAVSFLQVGGVDALVLVLHRAPIRFTARDFDTLVCKCEVESFLHIVTGFRHIIQAR